MSEKQHEFGTDAITVIWRSRRCIHSAECVARLPAVFEPGERPWIHPDRAGADEVAAVVMRCPTGALQFVRKDGGDAEPLPPHNTIRIRRDGPSYVRGDIEVRNENGEVLLRETRIALCRCGASANRPLCDNMHRETAFRDSGRVMPPDATEASTLTPLGAPGAAPAARGPLVITLRRNGPAELSGPFVIGSADGKSVVRGTQASLCRCGQSANKPFCDGSHERVGFVSD